MLHEQLCGTVPQGSKEKKFDAEKKLEQVSIKGI
jgi:hypothetical protein